MKLTRSISISAPKVIKKIPTHLKLAMASRSSSCHYQPLSKKPLLNEGESSDGTRNAKVPKGSLAVYVGPHYRRFVIPVSFLAMPDFSVLMESVAEEYGCDHHGAIHIPCDEDLFQKILTSCSQRKRTFLPPKIPSNIPIISTHWFLPSFLHILNHSQHILITTTTYIYLYVIFSSTTNLHALQLIHCDEATKPIIYVHIHLLFSILLLSLSMIKGVLAFYGSEPLTRKDSWKKL